MVAKSNFYNGLADKPIINSEIGGGYPYCDNETSWMKSVLLSPFTGLTGSFPWNMSNREYEDEPNTTYRDELWELYGLVRTA